MTTRARPGSALARAAIFFLKVGLAAALIGWLVWRKRLDLALFAGLRPEARALLLLLVAFALVLGGMLLLARRLQLLLSGQSLAVSYRRALGLTLLGSFFGCLLPGLIGGDAVKALYVCSALPQRRAQAFAAVVIDRAVGLYALLLLGSLAAAVLGAAGGFSLSAAVLGVAPGAVLALTAGALLVARENSPRSRAVPVGYSLSSAAWRHFAGALREYLRSPRLLAGALLLSLANHALVVGGFVVAGSLLGDELHWLAHFALDPLAMVLNMIPLTPGGLGVAESAFSFLYQAAGSPNGAAVGLLGRMLQYAVLVPSGGLAFLALRLGDTEGPRASQPGANLPEEVRA